MSNIEQGITNFDWIGTRILCVPCALGKSIFHQFQGAGIAPPNAGRAGRDTTEIALQGETRFSLNEKRFFRAGGPADQTHIVGLITDDQIVLGRTGCIYKRACNGGEKGTTFSKDSDAGSSGIGHPGYMVQGTSYFAVPATRTFGMIDLYPCHVHPPSPKLCNVSVRGFPVSSQPRRL